MISARFGSHGGHGETIDSIVNWLVKDIFDHDRRHHPANHDTYIGVEFDVIMCFFVQSRLAATPDATMEGILPTTESLVFILTKTKSLDSMKFPIFVDWIHDFGIEIHIEHV